MQRDELGEAVQAWRDPCFVRPAALSFFTLKTGLNGLKAVLKGRLGVRFFGACLN